MVPTIVSAKYGEVMIANKHYPLSPDLNPGGTLEAVSALHELIAAMQAEGYPISDQYSGFRSYDTQVGLYRTMINQDGQPPIVIPQDRVIVNIKLVWLDLIDTMVIQTEPGPSKWLLKNAAKYGFVVRYHKKVKKKWQATCQKAASRHLSLKKHYGFTGGDYVDNKKLGLTFQP